MFYFLTLIMSLGFDAFSGPTLILLWILHSSNIPDPPRQRTRRRSKS
jgi:hypothetical protein